MAETGELLRKAAERHGLSVDEVAAQIVADSPHIRGDDARWLTEHFFNGNGCPVIVATGIIAVIADRARCPRDDGPQH